jgi:hypothetical protein
VVVVVTKISFCWLWVQVSMQTFHLFFQTNAVKPPLVFTLMSPLFSLSFWSSHGACLFCWALLSSMNLFYICPSHQKVGDERKLSVNILCVKPSTLRVKCLAVAYVAVMLSVAQCVFTQVHSHVIIMYTLIHHRVGKF